MRYRPIICIACHDPFVLGQKMCWAIFTTVGGGGGDRLDDNKWLIHDRKECKEKALDYEQKNNWPTTLRQEQLLSEDRA